MGCWNNTCAISRLPILCGDEVVVLFLVRNNNIPERLSSPHSYHCPLPFYVEGTYNDYGAVENEHGVMLEPILEFFRNNIKEYDLGENEYHDIQVKREGLTWQDIMEADHEDRFYIEEARVSKKHDYRHVTHVQIRRDIWNSIIEQFVETKFTYVDNKLNRVDITYSDYVNDFLAFFNELKSDYNGARYSLRGAFDSETNRIGKILKDDYKKNMDFMTSSEYLRDMIDNNPDITPEEMWPVVDNALQLSIVTAWLSRNGSQWMVPGHLGQESDTDGQTSLANIILKSAEVINNRWDDEE